MKDRLLRPSLVGVSKKKSKKDEKNEQKDEKTNKYSQNLNFIDGCSLKISTYMIVRY